jgi:hypothetical protein
MYIYRKATMLIAHFKLLNVSDLPAKDPYPPSVLVSLYDPETSDSLTLISDEATRDRLKKLPQFSDVSLKLRWRRIDLAALGGSGRARLTASRLWASLIRRRLDG